MKLSVQNLHAISQIYDVVLDQSQWSSVLDELDCQIGSIGCNVFVADHRYGELTALHVSNKLLPALKYYQENGYIKLDEMMLPNYQKLIPEQRFVLISDLYLESNKQYGTNIDGSEFESWIEENLGITRRFTSPLKHRKEYIDLATFQFGKLSTPEIQQSLERAKIYLPHLAKAVELTRPFNLLRSRFQAILSALDRFHLGVAIFSTDGQIVVANLAAQEIFDRGDGLVIRNSKLVTTVNSSTAIRLQEAMHIAIRMSTGTQNNYAKRVDIPRRTGASSYIIDVSPLRSRDIDLNGFFRGVITIIVDPDHYQIIDVTGLELLFSLTDAEKEVCNLLVSGHTTSEIADIRDVNPDTIRKQINSLLAKTKSRNRPELVQLALSINIPIDQKE